MSEELANYETQTLSVAGVKAQVSLIHQLLTQVMQKDQHFGIIPGCGPKPTLLKAGAEKICFTFRLAPEYEVVEKDLPGGHREYRVTCTLKHMVSGQIWGQGLGMASTMESKHRYRGGSRSCPKCGQEAIIKGKEEFGGGWLCFGKRGGCGTKWPDGAVEIESQATGKTENPDPADQFNTVLKMSKKRALVDSCLTSTAASDIFTQDIEDMQFAPPVQPNKPPTLLEPQEKPKPNGSPQPEPNSPPAAASTEGDAQESLPELISERQGKRLWAILLGAKKTDKDLHEFLLAEYGIESVKEIERGQYEAICAWAAKK